MNEHDADHNLQLHDHHKQELDAETMLETRITHVLQEQAMLVHFTPAQREQVMRRIATRPRQTFFSTPMLGVVAALVILLAFGVVLLQSFRSSSPIPPVASVQYTVNTSLATTN